MFIAGAGVIASVIAFALFHRGASLPMANQPTQLPAETPSPVATDPAFEKSADRVTLGSGNVATQTDAASIAFDRVLRRMADLPEGDEKVQLAHQIESLKDRAAVPVLIDWATVTTDRAVLRAAINALAHLSDAETVEDIRQRYAAARFYDERYRLAKILRNITNPEAASALMELARTPEAPIELVTAATDALATVGTPPAVSLLLQKLEHDQGDNGARLETAIARIDRVEALPTLQYAARGNKDASSVRTRVAAIQALANFSDDQTKELLTQLRADTTQEVRAAADAALSRAR